MTLVDSLEATPDDSGEAASLRAALEKLPDAQRLPLVLHYAMGFEVREISYALRIPLGTVKSRMMRGRVRLAEMLKEDL